LTCDEARERLPWLANGSLPPEEAAAVEAHLAACPACREDREATRLAARLFATHPSPGDLVAYTFGDLAGAAREAIAGHLATCAACAGEQALSAESRRREASLTARPERPPEWRRLLLAAAVGATVLASAGWFWSWQRWQQDGNRWARRQERLLERLSRLEQRPPPSAAGPASPEPTPAMEEQTAPVESPEDRVAALEGELARLRQPQPGVRVVELLAEEMVVRGQAPAPPAIDSALPATLLLVAEGVRPGGSYRISARRGSREGWGATVAATTAGELSLHLPAASLPPAEYELRVTATDGTTVGTYRLRVE
jgi:hypothetical protein